MRILSALLFAAMAGCTGDLVEIGAGGGDLAGGGGGDMAQGGGGGEMGPNTAKFFPDIQKDVDTLTCSITACHGGAQAPVLKPMAVAGTGDANYTNFMTAVSTGAPSQSLVLTKNLPGASHGGGAKFTGTRDPVYQRWLGWISAGAPKQ
jgi:hypothetical protein